jgi:hypothetical protein
MNRARQDRRFASCLLAAMLCIVPAVASGQQSRRLISVASRRNPPVVGCHASSYDLAFSVPED